MVISFQLENVRNHLLKKGIVYTLRSKPHKVGLDWANSGRTTKKIADVNITEIKFKYLYQYLKHSGFEKIEDWLDAYCKINDASTLPKAVLYKVELLSTSITSTYWGRLRSQGVDNEDITDLKREAEANREGFRNE